jgi:hypothetical protein
VNEWIPRNTWVAGGIATALLMLWFVTTGDTASGVRLSSDPEALRLLRNAENAAHTTPYEGSQFISSWSRSGMATTSLVKVAHIPGSGTQVRVQGTTADVGGQVFETDDTQQTGGLTGYTPRMLDLLSRNYAVVRAGQDKVCGRPTFVVEARRADGSAAGRFYLDRQTGLMLRREVLDQQGREVTFTVFFEIRLVAPKPQFVPAAATRTIEAPWAHRLAGADLGAMRYHGWPVHTGLPDRLSLYDARQSDGDSPVLHLSYSDGLSVVSVFVQRGILDANSLAGWRRANRGGRTVYLRDTVQQRAMWASEGYVFTVLADAPPPVVDSAVAALPHGDVGFWGRLARGMNRLTAWANPFD